MQKERPPIEPVQTDSTRRGLPGNPNRGLNIMAGHWLGEGWREGA